MARLNIIQFSQNAGTSGFVAITVALCAALFAAIFFTGGGAKSSAAVGVGSSGDTLSTAFSECSGPFRSNCVVDGDTFWFAGNKIRIADINTPELGSARCAYESELGEQAKQRLLTLLNAGSFTLAANPDGRDQDKYGRDLRVVTRGGESLGDVLVAEGLAEHWQGYKREWC